MTKGYFVVFKTDVDKYKINEQAFLSKDDYRIYKKHVKVLRVYSDKLRMVNK